MSFWTDDFVEEVTQANIARVISLEESEAEKLAKNLKIVRRQLAERLTNARPGTFTSAKLEATLRQVDDYLVALSKSLKEDMGDSATKLGERGILDLIKETLGFTKKFDGAAVPINLDAALIVQDSKSLLVNKYDASIDAYSAAVRGQITQGLTESVLRQDTVGEVVHNLGQYVTGEEWKLLRLARTELHNVYGETKRQGMLQVRDDVLPDLKKTLFHPMDKRTGADSIYADRKHLIAEIDEPFIYTWKGKRREFMTPPDRPNDRSILVPYREAWGKTK